MDRSRQRGERPPAALAASASSTRALALVAAVALASSAPLAAQTLEGRVMDEADDRPVATALVRLVDEAGDQRAISVADSSGHYRILAPEPGVYRLEAVRIGYDDFETPLLEAGEADGVYPLDLLMRRSPVPIVGVEITVEQLERRMRLMTGISLRALRWDPIRRADLLDHIERAHDLTAVMRWSNYPGIEVRAPLTALEGPCYLIRRSGCLPIYLNGSPLYRQQADLVPLEMLEAVVVVSPNETIRYPDGAVLLYTPAWIR